jgi:leucyl-tRNA synthetase
MGVTFCAVAAEHPLAAHAAAGNPAIAAFIDECKHGGTTEAELATQEKKGIATGLVVEHPLTHEPIPVWIGNYVLMGYGDGAVMGVPAHDERDFAFAKKYDLDILQVIHVDGEPHFTYDHWQDWYALKDLSGERAVTINSDNYSGLSFKVAIDAVAAALAHRGLGAKKTTWRLRDWGVSRQRFWGTPVPIIHCGKCGVVPVPEKDLPVVLPEDLVPDGSGNPLSKHAAFLNVACPTCGQPAKRETDTLDTFVDSAWYYMRYCDPKNDQAMIGPEAADYWLPVDQYIGGIEHAILHLLYARFWTKVMRDLKLVSIDEPFTRLLTQGMVLNDVWTRTTAQGGIDYFPPDEVKPERDAGGRVVGGRWTDGQPVDYRGVLKMGKTERNGVDPQELIDRYGADTARLFVMFASPPDQTLEWNDAGVEGASRFLRRVWQFGARRAQALSVAHSTPATLADDAKALRFELHTVLRQINYDYERMQYNTVISGAMKLLNALEAHKGESPEVLREGYGILLRTLYPACPHTAWALWEALGYGAAHGDLLDAPWPEVDEAALVQSEVTLVLQVNGKVRGSIKVAANAGKHTIEAAATHSPDFIKFAEGKRPKKVIVVPGRLVNVVV